MSLDHGPRTGAGVEFCMVLIAVWVWAAGRAVTKVTPGSGEGRMPSTSPGDQGLHWELEEGRSRATSDWQPS